MALDTRDRRMSMFTLALPFGRVLPHRDGSITEQDFEQFLYLYRGIQAGLFIEPPPVEPPIEELYQAVGGMPAPISFVPAAPAPATGSYVGVA